MPPERSWWQRIRDRLGPEPLAAALTIPALILFILVLAVLVASGR
jgi:hypothetical protein